MNISVIIPAYNEEANIEDTISLSLVALRPLFDNFEILIIDDASSDQTGEIANELASKHPEINVIHNPTNKGQGESLRIGFKQARYELVIHNAMDYPFDLINLEKMLPLILDADIVIAARKQRSGYSTYRKLASITNLTLLKLLFGLNISDYNFVQLYRKNVLDNIPIETHSTAFLTPEILIRAHDLGYRIKEIKIDYRPREKGEATSGKPSVILLSIRDMSRFWVKRVRNKRRGKR